jgi:hypothetical protein
MRDIAPLCSPRDRARQLDFKRLSRAEIKPRRFGEMECHRTLCNLFAFEDFAVLYAHDSLLRNQWIYTLDVSNGANIPVNRYPP